MSQNNPDVWVIVELSGSKVEDRYHRVLAGWYGGFAGGDSWRMSSGVTRIVDKDTYWEIHNDSGSIYNCHKEIERFSGYTQNVYQSYYGKNTDEISINHVTLESILAKYQS
jgi:hypothetical protein